MPMDEQELELLRQALEVAHGQADVTPAMLLRLLQIEAAAVAAEGRLHLFKGTRGPWIRMVLPPDPLLLEPVAELVLSLYLPSGMRLPPALAEATACRFPPAYSH